MPTVTAQEQRCPMTRMAASIDSPAPSSTDACEDPILNDLRAFARELGICGAAALNKDELVESLRQYAVLADMLRGVANGAPVPPGSRPPRPGDRIQRRSPRSQRDARWPRPGRPAIVETDVVQVFAPDVAARETSVAGRPVTVLIVEDEPLIALTIVDMLEELGYSAIQASTAGQALELFQACDVDLVITDLGLPDMPGLALVARLRQLAPTLPIVIASGQALADDGQGGSGRTVTITKPFQMFQLEDAIGKLLS
jgi:CheY-like chemotaxis protein